MSSEEHVLTPTRAFVCLTLFDMIRMPLALLPLLIVYMIEVKQFALKRFLNGSEALLFTTFRFISGSNGSYQITQTSTSF